MMDLSKFTKDTDMHEHDKFLDEFAMNMGSREASKQRSKRANEVSIDTAETGGETNEEGEELDSDGDEFELHEWINKMGQKRSIKKKKRKKFDKDDHDYTAAYAL